MFAASCRFPCFCFFPWMLKTSESGGGISARLEVLPFRDITTGKTLFIITERKYIYVCMVCIWEIHEYTAYSPLSLTRLQAIASNSEIQSVRIRLKCAIISTRRPNHYAVSWWSVNDLSHLICPWEVISWKYCVWRLFFIFQLLSSSARTASFSPQTLVSPWKTYKTHSPPSVWKQGTVFTPAAAR